MPRSILVPSYLETPDGIRTALIAAYSGMRYYYSNENGFAMTVLGTDEFTTGALATSDEVAINTYSATLDPGNGAFQVLWNNAFTYINMCNSVIQFEAGALDMPADEGTRLIAEAKFLRANYYFLLLRTFGGVPLDLGSGNLKFNTVPITTSVRNSVSEIYDVIIQDLKDAISELPNIPNQPGRAGKAVAMHVLATVYLTRGWTAFKKSDDFLNAYNMAKTLIDSRSIYNLNLEEDFVNVNKQQNEHGPEVIWTIEHTKDLNFNESDVSGGVEVSPKGNASNYYFHPFFYYQTITRNNVTVSPCWIDMTYSLGWVRFRPTQWLVNNCFADKVNDSRYDKLFRTLWLCNSAAGQPLLSIGDTAFYMPGYDVSDAEKDKHKYLIFGPSDYSTYMYPDLLKFDDYDGSRAHIYYGSTRPFIVYKLSETYLIAAEAALKDGRPNDAVPYINAIRERAAYRATNTAAQNAAAKAAMDISISDVNIDLILDERSRELCGEQRRWFDLVRTNKLIERANLVGASNIKPFHILRPIPQSQIDLMSNADKSTYQNPGY
jgi:hypothetical protein